MSFHKDLLAVRKEAIREAQKAVHAKLGVEQSPKKPGKTSRKKPRRIIAITGTPGTGKTTTSRTLAKALLMKHLDVSRIIRENSLSEGYDADRKCEVIDTKKLTNAIIALIRKTKESIIIDSHLSHYIPRKYIDLCIVTKCGLKDLEKRLKKRNYHKQKVRENLDSEIFDVCLTESLDAGHDVLILDTGAEIDLEKIKARLRPSKA